MVAGARGVKIWKNIGMALKIEAGQYIMVDDPVFEPIFAFLEKEKIYSVCPKTLNMLICSYYPSFPIMIVDNFF